MTIPDDVLFRDLGGEAVLLHLGSGQYFGLDEVGTAIWNLVAEGLPLDRIVDRLSKRYDAEGERIEADVRRIVGELCDRDLLERARDETD